MTYSLFTTPFDDDFDFGDAVDQARDQYKDDRLNEITPEESQQIYKDDEAYRKAQQRLDFKEEGEQDN